MSQHDPMRQALEEALLENPDDAASHMAYADYLREQGDSRGELIQVQLALEDPGRTPDERKRLKRREEELLDAHEREWLGELAPFLLCTEEEEWALAKAESHSDYLGAPAIAYSWTRGWLDRIECRYLTVEMVRKLGRAPIARLLYGLTWTSDVWARDLKYAEGPDVPQPDRFFQPFEVLAAYPAICNLRVFQIGKDVDPEEWEYRSRCRFYRLAPFVERMPRLEDLSILAYFADYTMAGYHEDEERTEMRRLFSLPTLSNLRVLRHYNGYCYPLEALAENAALGNLTHLLCYPNSRARLEGRDRGWATAISRAGVKAVCWSPHLKSLSHLQMRCCDGGDEMVQDVVYSGILRRLKLLDLRHGRVGDAGAKELAKCPEVKGMEIDLGNNRLTDRGISALLLAGAKLRSDGQQQRPYRTAAMFRGEMDIE